MREHVTVGGPTDTDVLDSDGDGYLDLEAGHGTFIAGLLQQVAGGADVVMRAGISPTGITDEFTVAGAVRELLDLCGVQIVNLSLGGYVHDDEVGLLGWDALLDREDCVFVAAAGNHGSDRPFFPAADPRVIAVAALGTNGSRAAWSNYGAWVQACVPGEHLLSAYVQGRDEFDADGDGSPDEFAGPDPCALWSGTSFAAPQVAGLIAAESARTGSSVRDAAQVVLGSGKSVTGLGRKLSSPLHGRRLVAATP
jgi:subtilisin family serine protease